MSKVGRPDAVIEGTAHVAAVDSYALVLLQKYQRDLTSQLRVVARTSHTAIPPLEASGGQLEFLQDAFLKAHEHSAIRAA